MCTYRERTSTRFSPDLLAVSQVSAIYLHVLSSTLRQLSFAEVRTDSDGMLRSLSAKCLVTQLPSKSLRIELSTDVLRSNSNSTLQLYCLRNSRADTTRAIIIVSSYQFTYITFTYTHLHTPIHINAYMYYSIPECVFLDCFAM